MSWPTSSYRQILRSSSIIGGASVINILLGLIRTKFAAVLLGPAGIGFIGLLQSLMATASMISALGLGTVGTRQIAEAVGKGDESVIAITRWALFLGSIGLAIVGAILFWLLSGLLATHVMNDPASTSQLGWLAVGVALSVAAGSQNALLNGLRRIGDLARVSIASALLSTMLGIGALFFLKRDGVIIFVLATPIASFIFGHWFVRRLDHIKPSVPQLSLLTQELGVMVRLGVAFVVSGIVTLLGHLFVRVLIQRELGSEALGHFQAAWMISMTYIGFVLNAMSTDYYPRLTTSINDHVTANRLVNEQAEVALLITGPIFLVMLALTPWIIELLYSSDFDLALTVLRWQILGDILKVASWPLGFVILAAGDGRTFVLTEALAIGVFCIITWIGLPLIGIQAAGVGFLVMYGMYFPLLYWLGRKRTGLLLEPFVIKNIIVLLFVASLVAVISVVSIAAGVVVGLLVSFVAAIHSLAQLGKKTDIGGLIGAASIVSRNLILKVDLLIGRKRH